MHLYYEDKKMLRIPLNGINNKATHITPVKIRYIFILCLTDLSRPMILSRNLRIITEKNICFSMICQFL